MSLILLSTVPEPLATLSTLVLTLSVGIPAAFMEAAPVIKIGSYIPSVRGDGSYVPTVVKTVRL